MRLGMWELLLIFAVLLLLFGATKLPQLGSSLGQSIRNFKKGFAEADAEDDKPQQGNQLSSTSGTDKNVSTTNKTGSPQA